MQGASVHGEGAEANYSCTYVSLCDSSYIFVLILDDTHRPCETRDR
jgi:hypothetical protein